MSEIEEQQDNLVQNDIQDRLEISSDDFEAQEVRLKKREEIKEQIKARIQERIRRKQSIQQAMDAPLEQIMGADPNTIGRLMDLPKGAVASVLKTVESIKDFTVTVAEKAARKDLTQLRDRVSVKEMTPKTSTDVKIEQMTPEEIEASGAQVTDVAKGVVAGVLKTAESIKNLGFDVVDAVDKLNPTPMFSDDVTEAIKEAVSVKGVTPEVETAAGKVAESITQFSAAFLPINQASRAKWLGKLGKVAGVPKGVRAAAKGAVADFIAFEERMALTENLLQAIDPELAKKLPAYLKEDADDSPFETRLVNALEGAGFGVAADFVLNGVRSVREMHRAQKVKKIVDKTIKPIKDNIAKMRKGLEGLAEKQVQKTKEAAKKTRKKTEEAAQPSEAAKRLKQAIEEPPKETKTRSELAEAAKLLGVTVEDLRTRDAYKAAKALKVDDLTAAVTVIQDNVSQEYNAAIKELAPLIKAGDARARAEALELATDLFTIGRTAQDVAGEAARGMQFRTQQPSVQEFNAIQKLIADGKISVEDEQDLVLALVSLAELDGDVAGFMGSIGKQKLKTVKDWNDLIARRFKSFLLSSPRSLLLDVASDTYRHTWEVADRFAAATVSSARRGAKAAKAIKKEKGWIGFTNTAYRNGAFRQATEPTDVTFVEAKALAEGYAQYWKQVIVGTGKIAKLNVKKAAEAIAESGAFTGVKTGVKGFLDDMAEKAKSVRLDSSTKLNVQETDVKIADLVGKPDNVALRALDYATASMEPVLGFYRNKDHVGQAIVFRAELQARAISRATNEGLEGAAYNARVKELTTDIWEQENLKDFLDKKKISSLNNKKLAQQVAAGRQARAEAKRVSLTEDLTGFGKAAESLVRSIPGGDLLFPFVKTTYNLTKYELAKSPLSLLNVRGDSLTQKALFGGSARERDLAMGRMALATGMNVLAFKAAYDGLIRGSVIKDPGQRATLDNAGMFENSMRIGNTVIGLNDFSPLSAPFIRAANIVELFHYMDGDTIEDDLAEDLMTVIASTTLGIADQMASSNFTGQMGDLFNVVTEQDEYGMRRIGKSLITGLTVPGAVAWTTRFWEDNAKQTDTLWQSVLARLNLGEDKLDKFGRPIPKRSTSVGNIIPISITQYGANDPLAIEELNNGTIIRKPSRIVSTDLGQARLKPEEYNRLLEIISELKTYDALVKIVDSPFYQSLPNIPAQQMEKLGPVTGTRGGVLRKVYQQKKATAQEILLLERPEIVARSRESKLEYFVGGKEAPVTRFAPNEK